MRPRENHGAPFFRAKSVLVLFALLTVSAPGYETDSKEMESSPEQGYLDTLDRLEKSLGEAARALVPGATKNGPLATGTSSASPSGRITANDRLTRNEKSPTTAPDQVPLPETSPRVGEVKPGDVGRTDLETFTPDAAAARDPALSGSGLGNLGEVASTINLLRERSKRLESAMPTMAGIAREAALRNRVTPAAAQSDPLKALHGSGKTTFGSSPDLTLSALRGAEGKGGTSASSGEPNPKSGADAKKNDEAKDEKKDELKDKMKDLAEISPPYKPEHYFQFRDFIAAKGADVGKLDSVDSAFEDKARTLFNRFQSIDTSPEASEAAKRKKFQGYVAEVEQRDPRDRFQKPIETPSLPESHGGAASP